MNQITRKLKRVILGVNASVIPLFSPALATRNIVKLYASMGMKFVGRPNYISSRVNFDGTDYSLIEIHEGVTISSYVRVLTHDWSLFTVGKAFGVFSDHPIGRISPVVIGPYTFIGTGSVVMPGAIIGRGCLIGAGTVVRGTIPDGSIVVGSPGKIIGQTADFVARQLERTKTNYRSSV